MPGPKLNHIEVYFGKKTHSESITHTYGEKTKERKGYKGKKKKITLALRSNLGRIHED